MSARRLATLLLVIFMVLVSSCSKPDTEAGPVKIHTYRGGGDFSLPFV